ncbi:sensor histidine kinase [Streptococcus pluranimalium]|uniref:sensor histidine kinase n=1 Tax=Streptococcus pluranimalium TaxID=82348 RepID=UPI0039FBBC52
MIINYLKEYGPWYVLYFLMTLTYHLMFYLYHLPHQYFLASLAINMVFLCFWSILSYQQFKRKIMTLENLKAIEDFPDSQVPSEIAYREFFSRIVAVEAQKVLELKREQDDLEGLVKMWSHQMKIPVSAMSLMIQTDHINKSDLQVQTFRLEQDINNLLAYLKYKADNDDYRFSKISLKACVSSVIKTFSSQCIAKNIQITLTGDNHLITDDKWLSFSLSQVIDNAIKYSSFGSEIKISIKDKSIEIQDFGIGILEEDIPRLFELGFTGYNGHAHKKATGLGLYMTKQILDRLGFTIVISSRIDQGTKVTIEKNN